ncbi:MAG: phosphotransferase, partial [Candidatus Moranbacteria bacterium]|nr:phosphotransferase [Candidatus Moranbacteria bacterium]
DLNNFFAELNDFLRILHTNRIYHRDLHEGNIMIDDKGKPWIIDFGDAVRAFSEEEAYVSHFMNPKTKRLENMRYTSDENNLAKIRSDLRSYVMGRKANT